MDLNGPSVRLDRAPLKNGSFMISTPAISVAIGLILMYLLLSLACTVINEAIATVLNWRASTLAKGIEHLLDDPTLRHEFKDHGLIKTANVASGPGGPSYLPGRTFALALLGSLD